MRLYNYSSTPSASSAEPGAPSSSTSYAFRYHSSIPTSHQRTVRSLAFSPTGTTLATASFDSTVGVWQQVDEAGVDDGEPRGAGAAVNAEAEWEAVDPLEGHESECKSAEWSFDGRLLASCSRDKSVWIWEGEHTDRRVCRATCATLDRTLTQLSSSSQPSALRSSSASPS